MPIATPSTYERDNVKTIIPFIRPLILTLLALASLVSRIQAREVSITDPGWNAAIRDTLPIPFGPPTEPMVALDLGFNQLTNLTLPADLQNLIDPDLDFDKLSSLNFLSDLTSPGFLHLRANQFTNFSLPAGLTSFLPRPTPLRVGAV